MSEVKNLHKLEQIVVNAFKQKSESNLREFIEGLCAIQEKNNDSVQTLYLKSDDYCAIVSQHTDEKDHIFLWTLMLQLHCCYANNDQTDFYIEKMLRYVQKHGLSVFVQSEKDQYYDFIQSIHNYADLRSDSKMNEDERNEVFQRIEQILERIDITGK